MDSLLRFGRKIIPAKIFRAAQPVYHYVLALAGAIIYRFPSAHIKVVGITGTKGKTTTAELVNTILEEAGNKTALLGTLRFKIADKEEPNLYKMTMPGRFFVQKFLRRAVNAKCDWAILEMTSEGSKQFRHSFIDLDALVFLNIAPEHIESHGSFEKYLAAKFALAEALKNSPKRPRSIISNLDDTKGEKFLSVHVENKLPFTLASAKPYEVKHSGLSFTFKEMPIEMKLVGEFNIMNALAAAKFATSQHISPEVIKKALEKVEKIRGRVEFIEAGQAFKIVVDYAHTPDSLKALYEAFPHLYKIAVLGNTGGGRDKWKRKEMARIADVYCQEILLTNEDPYDEDPQTILDDMRKGFERHEPMVLLDRRRAIATALAKAEGIRKVRNEDVIVLITGKGTDPFIMGPNGKKEAWDDASVVRQELKRIN